MPGEHGLATAQYSAMVAMSLVIFVLLANAIVVMYARGVLRAAVDEGVRAASRAGADVGVCEARARAAVDDLLGGRMGDAVVLSCTQDTELVSAEAGATFPAWLPGVPAYSVRAAATAIME